MENIVIKTCKIHGESEFSYRNDNRYRCKKCNTIAVVKRRRQIKLDAIQYKGGKCEKCGYDKCVGALEFHHLDPNEKDFNPSAMNLANKKWEIAKSELDKCELLCALCHREEHSNYDKLIEVSKTYTGKEFK